MRAILVSVCLIVSGCVAVVVGNHPEPEGKGVQKESESIAKVELEKYSATIQLDGYSDGLGLIGIGVPIIPIGQWKWLTGIGKDDLRLRVTVILRPKSVDGTFEPSSLRVIVQDRQYAPTSVLSGKYCGTKELKPIDSQGGIKVAQQMCLVFGFSQLRPPQDMFSLAIEGFPVVDYKVTRHVHGGFPKQ